MNMEVKWAPRTGFESGGPGAALPVPDQGWGEAFEWASDPIYAHDGNGTLRAWNRAAEQATGYARPQAAGMNVLDLVAAEHQGIFREAMARAQAGERPAPFEVDLLASDGSRVPVEISSSAGWPGNSDRLLYAICRPVGRRREAEAERIDMARFRAMRTMARGFAHDLNNLVMIVAGFAETLLAQTDPNDCRYRAASEIGKAADRALQVSRELESFTRLETVETAAVDVRRVLESLEADLNHLVSNRCEVRVTSEPGLWEAQTSAVNLREILLQLSRHALESMPRGGRLRVHARNLKAAGGFAPFTSSPPEEYVVVTVSDTGPPIEPESCGLAFEPFFSTRNGRRARLGLAAAYMRARQCGAFMTARPGADTGVTFELNLRRDPGTVNAAGEAAPAAFEPVCLDDRRQQLYRMLDARRPPENAAPAEKPGSAGLAGLPGLPGATGAKS